MEIECSRGNIRAAEDLCERRFVIATRRQDVTGSSEQRTSYLNTPTRDPTSWRMPVNVCFLIHEQSMPQEIHIFKIEHFHMVFCPSKVVHALRELTEIS